MDGSGYEILSMKEAGVDPDITEDGTTFEENAFKMKYGLLQTFTLKKHKRGIIMR